jgi:chromosome segregation ATPase
VPHDADELAREVESLHEELEAARARARQLETTLTHLDEQRTETENRLELSERQITDLAEQMERRQTELEEAREQALFDAFLEVVARRDAAAHEAAVRLDTAVGAVAAIRRRRNETAAALADVPARLGAAIPDEPREFEEAWARMVELVRANLAAKLEDELVDAAAASPAGRAIQELPVHLRELAVQRRRELQRQSRQELRSQFT